MDGLRLTAADRLVLESYKSVLEGFSEYLGPGYELVLHSLEDVEHAAIKVINGHYTGRGEGAPITDLALDMLAKIKESGDNGTNLIYFNRSPKGTPIRSATLPIVGENRRIIGLLCMNFYMDLPLHSFLDGIIKLNGAANQVVETFASTSDELIQSAVEAARTKVVHDVTVSASNKNKEIVAMLHRQDIFSRRDAVIKVAAILGISKNTVYMHLRNLNNSNELPK